MGVTNVYLMSATQTIEMSIDELALDYARAFKGRTDKEAINWAKSRLLSFNCKPCGRCEYTGQKSVKYLGDLIVTLQPGQKLSDGTVLQRPLTLPLARYYLQAPKVRSCLEVLSA